MTFYSDGMRVEEEVGRDQIFTFSGDIDMLRIIADNLMTTYRQEAPPKSARSRPGARSSSSESSRSRSHTVIQPENLKSTYEVLEISVSASSEEIKVAFRKMASLYHPDKVAHLAPEFREMADKKMKEINTAYGALKDKK